MTLTRQDVLDAARKIVAEKGPDYVYPRNSVTGTGYNGGGYGGANGPVYAEDGKPSCLVGHVIHALDPEAFAHLAAVEEVYGTESADNLTYQAFNSGNRNEGDGESYHYLPWDFWDAEAEVLMNQAQTYQDVGKAWGDALAQAEDEA